MKDEKVISEGYYAPFNETDKKRLYSCTKSIAALAVSLNSARIRAFCATKSAAR